MAMLEHGLPVIVTRPCYRYRNVPASALHSGMDHVVDDFAALQSLRKTLPRSRLGEIARQFADDLKSASAA